MPLTNGSGSGSWIRILLLSSLTFKMPARNNFCLNIFSAYYCLKDHLHNFPKIKSQKESQNSRNQGFSYYFCMMTEGSGSVKWIRIREAQKTCGSGGSGFGSKTLDPMDPEHCLSGMYHWTHWGKSSTVPCCLCLDSNDSNQKIQDEERKLIK